MTTVLARLCIRSDTATNFTSANTLLLANEMARESDTGKIKYGDGTTAWNSLAYWSPGGVSSFNTRTGAVTLTYADVTGALGLTPVSAAGAVSAVAATATGIVKSNGTALSAAAASDINTTLGYTPANKSGDTFTGKVILPASAVGSAGLNIGAGVAPTSPSNGDLWITGTAMQAQIGGLGYSVALVSFSHTISGAWVFTNVALTFGNSTAASTTNVANGAISTGNTKAVNVGTGGVAGSITNITIGTVGGGASNLLFHGTAGYTQTAQTIKSAAATLTAAEIVVGIVSYTGAAANITLPTGTALDTGFTLLVANTAFDFSVINTGSGTATMVINTGVTSLGALTITAGTSGQFRLRKTGTATYVLYRLS